ncbi:MAG: histone deacetylase family protein [Ilumatobacteraceae bacterium]|nr:histone deacetylase family protein [Ilumatobacter sp.]MCO5330372.1 histone deacetylase family protein [Ilumatobacteraceae bacterium]
MKTVFTDRQLLQDGSSELIDGKLVKAFECKERAEYVLARVREQGIGPVIEPTEHGLDPVSRVHTRPFIEFLRTAWDEWVADHGEYDALPLIWATRTLRQDRIPSVIDGKLSYFALDAGTPIMSGTWTAITAAADVALTGADLVLGGEQHAFSLCRPPGHHASADVYGGYCFFNNAAVAAQALRDGGVGKVAILDVDYHHGNGTQAIFYERNDVPFASIHGHPDQEYPYFLGYEDEHGAGAGEGANANYPLRHGSGWDIYEPALADAIRFLQRHTPDALVVSLGVDTYKGDPISEFKLDHEHYLRMGSMIAAMGLPTLVVFEGGYAVQEIGINAVNVLEGMAG